MKRIKVVFFWVLVAVSVIQVQQVEAAFVSGMVSLEDFGVPNKTYVYISDSTGNFVAKLILENENSFSYTVDDSEIGLEYKVQVYSPEGLSGWYATFPVVVSAEPRLTASPMIIPLNAYTFSSVEITGWRTNKGRIAVKITGFIQYNRGELESQLIDIRLITSSYNTPDSLHPDIVVFVERPVKKVTVELGGSYQKTPFEIVRVFSPYIPENYHNVSVKLQLTEKGKPDRPLTEVVNVDSVYIQ